MVLEILDTRWYGHRALRGTGEESRRTRLRRAGAGLVVGSVCLTFAACGGGGGERQDADEPSGKFPVDIAKAQFPTRQRLAETSYLRLAVKNTGQKTIPALAVTISIAGNQGEDSIRPFSIRSAQPGLAVPDRPVWILENGWPKYAGSSEPAGAQTANEKTFDFGALKKGKTVDALWKVTAVKAGDYKLTYQVDAGLNGKAKAVTADGKPAGSFVVQISDVPPQTGVNDKGEVVVLQGPHGTTAAAKGPKGGAAVVHKSGSK
jgi:hypothetical protein